MKRTIINHKTKSEVKYQDDISRDTGTTGQKKVEDVEDGPFK